MNTTLRGTPAARVWLGVMALVLCQPGAGLLAQPAASAEKASRAPAAKAPELEVALDTSDAPEMALWAAPVKIICEQAYPLLLEHLGAPGFEPPTKAKIVVKNMKGIAGTAGATIYCSAAYFKEHPDDAGAVVHELCHVVQDYGGKPVPGWVTEGIADYVRWFCWEPASRRPRANLRGAKYTDSYQTTAAFFDWIVRTKDETFVRRLNAAAREGRFKIELFQEYTGKTVDELWSEFAASQPRERRRPR